MRMVAQLYTYIVLGNREETSVSVCDQGYHDTAVNGRVTDLPQAVRAISWQLMPCSAAVRGSQFPIKLSGAVFLVRQHFSIAHEKSQEGSKGGNGFFHVLGVLPGVGSTSHCRPLQTQMGASVWGGEIRRIKG